MRQLACACLVFATACITHNNAVCDANLDCPDPSKPYCDLDGSIGGTPNTCIAVVCQPGEFGACSGDNAEVCTADGDGYDQTPCANGCGSGGCKVCEPDTMRCGPTGVEHCTADGVYETAEACTAGCMDLPAPHCAYLQPLYLPDICDTPATQDLVANLDTTIDTTSMTACNGGIVDQGTNEPPLCVVHYKSIQIASGVTLAARYPAVADGGGHIKGPAIALVADDGFDVSGTLDVGAFMATVANLPEYVSGAGGGYTTSGRGASTATTGGGGSGFATAGGFGGGPSGNTNNAGDRLPNPATDTVLRGAPDRNGAGGATLISCHGMVSVTGTVTSGGGGGEFGFALFGSFGAKGGGAGGHVVIQGLGVTITGGVFANGGGGGSGTPTSTTDGKTGAGGSASATAAIGGGASGAGGAGGNGGTGSLAPGNGFSATAPGGGGGSVGFLQTVTPAGVTPLLNPTAVSPQLQPNATAQLR